jgi:hypothetical protein
MVTLTPLVPQMESLPEVPFIVPGEDAESQ